MGSGIVMMASRLCAPACCSGLEVPPCCPCNCFAQLDLPYYILFGFTAVIGTVEMALAWFAEVNVSVLRLLRILAFFLLIAAHVCAIIKLCIMRGFCCQEML